ncbi:MAG: MBL fold metallo-hydrolase, partial [Actinomycetota bacterium]
RGRGSLRGLGLEPAGFVPPAWLAREDGHGAVRDAGLGFSEDERSIRLFPAGRRVASPAVRWSARTPVRAWGSVAAGGLAVEPVQDGATIDAGGVTMTALHTPGHASDHLCFFLEGAASLFAGDNILGEGTAVIAPPDGNMRAFLASLDRLDRLRIDRIYPGHFRPLDGGNEVIRELIRHRRERESMIVASLADGPLTIEEIVARVYVDTPAQLHPIARYSVQAHLEMLRAEGRAFARDDRWSAVP